MCDNKTSRSYIGHPMQLRFKNNSNGKHDPEYPQCQAYTTRRRMTRCMINSYKANN